MRRQASRLLVRLFGSMLAPVRWFGMLWRWADLDATDLHYYPGIALVAAGCWFIWWPLALVAFGLGLTYPAVRAVRRR